MARAGRFPVHAVRGPGGGCRERWIQIGPDAWVCSGWLLPRRAPPSARTDLAASWQPGTYVGATARGRQRVIFYRSVRALSRGQAWYLRGDVGFWVHARRRIMGQTFLVTHSGGYVASSSVRVYPTSRLVGLALSHPRRTLPLVVALRAAPLWHLRAGEARPASRTLRRYEVWPVRRRAGVAVSRSLGGHSYLHLSGRQGLWVRAEDVALAMPPPGRPAQVGPREQWVDVDASERLVYAMEGDLPRRVMLASLGPNTPTGTFRVEQKILYKDMAQRFGKDPFYLEAVPFVVFFRGDFAFHGAYWHDGFGSRRSHGCLNLSLPDARFLFRWLSPRLPPGFFAIYPTSRDPGAVVRVRGRYRLRPWERPGRKRATPVP